jgi:hypothetical protein
VKEVVPIHFIYGKVGELRQMPKVCWLLWPSV